jgi:hypothetical protein
MIGVAKTQRMRNYGEQRMSEYRRNLEAIVSQDPTVKEFRQKQQQQQEVTQDVINNISREAVKSRRKKKIVHQLPPVSNESQSEEREMPSHPLLNKDLGSYNQQPKSYKLGRPGASKQLKTSMRISLFDKAFVRDCM